MKWPSAALFLVIGLGCCGDTSPAGPKTVEFVRPEGASTYHFSFRAHQSASGVISGYIVSRSTPDYPSPFVIEGSVSCLRVVGRRASIGGELQRYSQEDMPDVARYHGWLLYVEDSRSDNGVSDRISKYIWVFDTPTSYCPDPGEDSADYYRGDGDVVVSVNE